MPPVPAARPSAAVVAVVALGGAVGALLRWSVALAVPTAPGAFPWTTLAVNVVGSLLLAVLPALVAGRRLLVPLLGPGVLGGFTTLSAASEETRALLAAGHTGLASAYLLGTGGGCVLAVAAVRAARGRRGRR